MWYALVSYIVLIYLLTNFVTPKIFNGVVDAYLVRPLLWTSLALLAFFISKRDGIEIWYFKRVRRWEFGRNPFEGALLIGFFQISLLIIAGIFSGFGRSPVSFTPLSILINAFFVFSLIFGIELSRAYLIKRSPRKNLTLNLMAITLFLVFINIGFNRFLSLDVKSPLAIIRFLGEMLIPSIAMGFFASYLAYLGGALTSIGYMSIVIGFEWFSPILPDLEWILSSLIRTMAPAIGFVLIESSIWYSLPKRLRPKESEKSTLRWIGVSVISLMMIFFSFGYFGIQPTVVCSGSMKPAIDVGDIVIVAKVPIESIKKGDIIEYRTSKLSIIHRVYDIRRENGGIEFITKGDANKEVDPDPVKPRQIVGKVMFIIPKVGWISIFIKECLRKLIG